MKVAGNHLGICSEYDFRWMIRWIHNDPAEVSIVNALSAEDALELFRSHFIRATYRMVDRWKGEKCEQVNVVVKSADCVVFVVRTNPSARGEPAR